MSRHNRERRKGRLAQYTHGILDQLAQAQAEHMLKPGNYYELPVRHDAGCDMLKGAGLCNCSPDVGPLERVPFPQEN